MIDNTLHHLMHTLDTALESVSGPVQERELAGDLDVAALRLQCLERRLGTTAAESPYLAFLRRTIELDRAPMAASA